MATFIKAPIQDFLSPIQSVLKEITREIKESTDALIHFYKLKEEINQRDREIEKLRNQLFTIAQLKDENERLNNLLQFRSRINYPTIAARVIGQDISNWYHGALINKGKKHGISPDQAVLSSEGLVGKVIEVFSTSAKVMILSDHNSQIGGAIHGKNIRGILQGNRDDLCLLNYLPRRAKIEKGDIVITSGFNSIFPKGILLGEIFEVRLHNSGLYQYAKVIPSADFNSLEEVLIVTSNPNLEEDPLPPGPEILKKEGKEPKEVKKEIKKKPKKEQEKKPTPPVPVPPQNSEETRENQGHGQD